MAIKRIAGLLLLGISGLAMAQSGAPKPKYGPWGVDYASMDKSVKPGDDFFGYAEGSWLKTAPIAPDKARAGYNYDMPDEAVFARPGVGIAGVDHHGARCRAAQALARADRRGEG